MQNIVVENQNKAKNDGKNERFASEITLIFYIPKAGDSQRQIWNRDVYTSRPCYPAVSKQTNIIVYILTSYVLKLFNI